MNDSLARSDQPRIGSYVRNLLWNEMGLLALLILEILILLPWYRAHVLLDDQSNIPIAYLAPLGFGLLVMYAGRFIQANQSLSGFFRLVQVFLLLLGLIVFSNWILYPEHNLSLGQLIYEVLNSFAVSSNGIPKSILLVIALVYLWWRGISNSTTTNLDFYSIRRNFRIGLFILALFGIFHRAEENSFLIAILPFFFASGFIAMTLGRTYRLSQRSAAFRLPFTSRWFFSTTALLVITIALGILGATVMQTEIARQIAEFVGTILLRGFQTFVIVISPLFLWIIPVAEKLAEMLMQQAPVEPTPSDPEDLLFENPEFTLDGIAERAQVPPVVIIGIVVFLTILVIFLVIRKTRRSRRSGIPNFGDEGESTLDRSSIQRSIRRLLNQAQESLDSIRRFGVSRRMLAATAIRRVYVQFLNLAEDLGRPRKSWETPFEFQRQISMMFPGEVDQIDLITKAYTQVRYGQFPEEEEIVSKVKEAWGVIQRAAR